MISNKATTLPLFRGFPALASVLALAVAGWPGAMASAQSTIKVPPQADISRQRVQPLPLPPIDYDFRIQSPEKSAVPRAIDEIEFSVRSIRVLGAEHLPEAQVRAIFAPLEGRTILLEELRKAAQQLEDRYREKGYFLTRVFVSPQQVKDGVLEVQVLEGYISAAFVEAPNEPSRRHAEKMLAPVINQRPARFLDLESRLLLLNDVPGLAATSILRQGAVVSSSEIQVAATRVPNAYRASFSNTASSTLGPNTYGLGATLSQPLGRPGLLDIDISASGRKLEELRTVSVRYAMPIGHRGTILAVGGLFAKARPGGTAAALNIRSSIATMNARLRAPLLRTRPNSVYLDLSLTVNRGRTDINFGAPVTLPDDNGTVAEASLTWQQAGWLNGATTVTVSVARGLIILGANGNSSAQIKEQGAKPDFTKLSYDFQRTQILTDSLTAQVSIQGQYTADHLVPRELVSFGGPSIGRGYDPSLLAGERGLGVAGELQYALPFAVTGLIEGTKLYSFADWARATTLASGPTSPKTNEYLSSLGVGVRTVLKSHLSIDLQIAKAIRTVNATARRGTRFNLSAFMFF